MIIRSYKYRIYPTPDQVKNINQTFDACRLVFNLGLEIKKYAYQNNSINVSIYDLMLQIKDLRHEYEWIEKVNSQALYAQLSNLESAYKKFFAGGGFPKFKKKNCSQSFQCRNNTRRIDWIKKTLTLPKITNIPIILSRPFEGKIKTVTISRTSTGKYFASILVESNQEAVLPPKPQSAIGIDLGITTFATLSTGKKIDNPRHLKQSIERLRVLHRRASRKIKGSNNRKKANKRVSLLFEKVTNQRNDSLHKISTNLIRDNQTDTICVEDLAVKNMVRNHKLAQAISDVSWYEFVRQLEYKGKWYGKNILKVDRFYASSKICSNCGSKLDQLDLSIREWTCGNCNVTHDRDHNAAINIRNSGLGKPVVPVEQSALMGCYEAGNQLISQSGLKSNDIITHWMTPPELPIIKPQSK